MEWGRQVRNFRFWLGWITSIAFTLGRKRLSSCFRESVHFAVASVAARRAFTASWPRANWSESKTIDEANVGTTRLRRFFCSRSNLGAAKLVSSDKLVFNLEIIDYQFINNQLCLVKYVACSEQRFC